MHRCKDERIHAASEGGHATTEPPELANKTKQTALDLDFRRSRLLQRQPGTPNRSKGRLRCQRTFAQFLPTWVLLRSRFFVILWLILDNPRQIKALVVRAFTRRDLETRYKMSSVTSATSMTSARSIWSLFRVLTGAASSVVNDAILATMNSRVYLLPSPAGEANTRWSGISEKIHII